MSGATRTPDAVRPYLDRDGYRLYELVWLRFVAGQMAPAVYDTTTVDFHLAALVQAESLSPREDESDLQDYNKACKQRDPLDNGCASTGHLKDA